MWLKTQHFFISPCSLSSESMESNNSGGLNIKILAVPRARRDKKELRSIIARRNFIHLVIYRNINYSARDSAGRAENEAVQ